MARREQEKSLKRALKKGLKRVEKSSKKELEKSLKRSLILPVGDRHSSICCCSFMFQNSLGSLTVVEGVVGGYCCLEESRVSFTVGKGQYFRQQLRQLNV